MKRVVWKKWALRATQGVLCVALAASVLVGVQVPVKAEAAVGQAVQPVAAGPLLQAGPVHLLSWGSSGSAVWALQYRLKVLGYYTYYKVTGYYGSITTAAVKRFQAAYGLKVDGIAGPITQREVLHAIVKRKLVADTRNYLGKPYVWGSSNPRVGFDCSGFIYYMFRKHGYPIPRYTSYQLYTKGNWISRWKLRPGDLVFFAVEGARISHVGFYIGNNQFISATSSKGIAIYSMSNSYWAPHYRGARRVY